MRPLFVLLFSLLSLCPGLFAAEDVSRLQRLEAALSRFQLERWVESPDWVLEDIAAIGFGYGAGGVLTMEAVETSVAHGRASARARAFRDIFAADLDGDMSVTRAEAQAVELSLSGRARGLLWTRFRKADLDRDGTISLKEAQSYAETRAMAYLPQARVQERRAFMLLDADGDGALTLDEAEGGLAALGKILDPLTAGVPKADL